MSLRNWMLCALASTIAAPSCLHAWEATKNWATVASEQSHQRAGVALVTIAVLVIAGRFSQKLRFLLTLWPFVFVAMGLYLLAWSDPEIWPRGPFSWLWMIEHNPEARQHKLYGFLLLALGTVEFLRARGKLSPRWQTWSFPLLAAFGALLLTLHSHESGLPKGWHPSNVTPASAATKTMVATVEPRSAPVAGTQQPGVSSDGHHHHGEASAPASGGAEAAPAGSGHQHHAEASAVASDDEEDEPESTGHHQHQMTPKMQRIQQQHIWMAILGVAIAVFKFLADGRFLRNRALAYIWPSAMGLLGLLLIFYRE